MDPCQLLLYIVIPTIEVLNASTVAAQQIIMGTIAHESHCGQYIKQIRGPALGICQMEPATHDDIIRRWLPKHPEVRDAMVAKFGDNFYPQRMMYDLRYSIAMCRLFYMRIPEHLPEAYDWEGMARYYKKYYNTSAGKATPADFLRALERHNIKKLFPVVKE